MLAHISLDQRVSCALQELIRAHPPLLARLVRPAQVVSPLLTLQQVVHQSLFVLFVRQATQAQFNALQFMQILPYVQELL